MNNTLWKTFIAVILVVIFLPLSKAGDVHRGYIDFENGNYSGAFFNLRDAAQAGDAKAQYYMGLMFHEGLGVSANDGGALGYWLPSARQGYMLSQRQLALMFYSGSQGRITQDYSQALVWFTKAADQRDPDSSRAIGFMYQMGLGVTKNYQEALSWYNKAAKYGSSVALNDIKTLEGLIVAQNEPPVFPIPNPIPNPNVPFDPSGTLYILAIGVKNFSDPSMQTLKYTENDASSLIQALQQQSGRVFSRVKSYLRTGQQATRRNILNDMQEIQRLALPGDTVIAFFSTHGQNAGSDYYLYASDTQSDNLSATGVRGTDIVAFYTGVRANTLLLLDSCFSGALSPSGKSGGDSTNTAFVDQVSRSGGIESAAPYVKTVISSASGTQRAWECNRTSHGCFTAALLDGLAGKAATGTGGISVNTLSGYVTEKIPALLRAENNMAVQRPNIKGDIPTWIISRP